MIAIRARIERADGRINFVYLAKFANDYKFGFPVHPSLISQNRIKWAHFIATFKYEHGTPLVTHRNGERMYREVIQFGKMKGINCSFARLYSEDKTKEIKYYKNSKRKDAGISRPFAWRKPL